jgi:hypothetical protein
MGQKNMEQSKNQSKEQNKQETQKSESIEQVTPDVEQETPELPKVDKAKYDAYTQLKFIKLSGAKLTDEKIKLLADMEAEIKSCSGEKPNKTVRAAIKNDQILMVEGVPLPAEYLQIIKDAGDSVVNYYLG